MLRKPAVALPLSVRDSRIRWYIDYRREIMMKQARTEVDRVVAALDETRKAEYFRNPDRPDASIMRPRRQRQPPEVVKAKSRIRVAAWRVEQDRRCAPTTAQIGAALVAALATTESLDTLTSGEPGIVGRMLVDLQTRGFDLSETLTTLKRLRKRLHDRVRYSEPV